MAIKLTKKQQKHLDEITRRNQMACSHSWNEDNECNYCQLSERDYSSSCCQGNEIGEYR